MLFMLKYRFDVLILKKFRLKTQGVSVLLAISFFTVIFSSLLWIIYALAQVMEKLSGGAAATAGILDISIYAAFVLLPVFALWVIFSIISQHLHNQHFNRNLYYLLAQMKKNQDYSDLLARIMLEGEQQLKDGFVIQQFDLFISDMNELISEIIQRSSLASAEQIERLWSKVRNGGKWAFAKVVIEVNQNQPDFQLRLYEKARRDNVLAGTILEFCARYLGTVDLLEKHDREKIFLSIIETGVLGKAYSIFSPIADEIRRNRRAASKLSPREEHEPLKKVPPLKKGPLPLHKKAAPLSAHEFEPRYENQERPQISILERAAKGMGQFNLIEKLGLFKKRKEIPMACEPEPVKERDPFSIALERSFGSQDASAEEPLFQLSTSEAEASPTNEPQFHISLPQEEKVAEIFVEATTAPEPPILAEDRGPKNSQPVPQEEMLSTRRTLDSLREEWENMKKKEAPIENEPVPEVLVEPISETDLSLSPLAEKETAQAEPPSPKTPVEDEAIEYPFGSWADEENYHK